ncbi:MAG: hypothetical protein ACM30I_01855 [Gemmatimonas sp.]
MTSVVAICNRALDMLGAEPVTSLADNTKAARLCARNFDAVRDAVLRAYPWNAAVRRASLAALSEPPAWGFARQFQLPEGPVPEPCLRILAIDGETCGMRYRIEGRRVLSDAAAPLDVLYIARIEDPAQLDPMLQDVIATRLAADLSYSLTASAALGQALMEIYQAKLAEARATDAQEGTADRLFASWGVDGDQT